MKLGCSSCCEMSGMITQEMAGSLLGDTCLEAYCCFVGPHQILDGGRCSRPCENGSSE
jgi:hypothetical protein